MSEQPLTLAVLAQFHRQVILPDVERIVSGVETRLRDEMQTLHDVVLKRLDHLDIEYEMIKAGLQRVEDRLEAIEAQVRIVEGRVGSLDHRVERQEGRLDHLESMALELRTRLGRVEERLEEMIAVEEKYPLRVEVQDLKARVERLHEDVRRLEHRIKSSSKG
jgi:chromosome segregation ATPase